MRGIRSKHVLGRVITLLCIVLVVAGSVGCGADATTLSLDKEPREATSSPCFTYWEQRFPGYKWLKLAEGELNNDGKPDLLVIFQNSAGESRIVAVVDSGADFLVSDPLTAPAEDQVIEIFDMDGKPPNEFSVSGRKGANIGSAVFRLEDGKIVQLFSSGYGDCC